MRKHMAGKLLVATLLTSAIAGCSKSLDHDDLLARATDAYRAGQLNAAVVDVRTALQQNPDSAAARRLHGEILLSQRAMVDAASNLERSLQAEESAEVAALYARALNGSGESRKVVEDHEAGRFAFAEDHPGYVAQVVIARVNTRGGEQVQDKLFDALAEHPDNSELAIAHAYLLGHHNRAWAEAADILREVTEREPNNDEAWSLLGLALRVTGDTEGARDAYRQAGELNPFRFEDRMAHISLLIDRGDHEEADRLLSRLENVDHPEVHYARARLLMHDGNSDQAVRKLQQVLAVNPEHIGALYMAGVANAQLGNLSTAEGQLRRFLSHAPGHAEASTNLAQLYLALDEPARAESLIRGVVRNHPDNMRAVNILGMALAAQGLDAETALYEELAGTSPDSPATRLQFGTQLLRSGELQRGIDELQNARDLDPHNPDIRSRLVLAHLLNNDGDQARAEASDYLQVAGDQPDPHILAGRLSLHEGDFEAAEAHFTRASEIHPDNLESRDGLAMIAMQRGDADRARSLLANAEDMDGLLMLAGVQEQQGDHEGVISTLQRAGTAYPDRIEPPLTEARYLFRQEAYDEAIAKGESLREDHGDDARVHQLLTGAYLASGSPEQALDSANRLLELAPGNPRALRLAAQAELVNDNAAQAEAHLRTIIDSHPDDVDTRRLLVETLLHQGKLREMNEELGKLPEGVIPPAQLLTARGRLALETGDLEQALELLSAAYDRQPNSTTLVFLSQAYMLKGETGEAESLLQAWLKDHPNDGPILHQLGSLYVSSGNDDGAVEMYERLLVESPDDVIALNNLAWLYREAEQDRALELASRAVELAPGHGAVTDTYAMVRYHRGEYSEALAANQKALESAPDNPQLLYHRARILADSGQSGDAREILEGLAEREVQFPEREDAMGLLERLSGS